MSSEAYARQELHISVRNLVEFIFREGDIDNRAGHLASQEAMLEGGRIHRKIQNRQGSSYRAEVSLDIDISEELYDMTIEGRADGIFEENGLVWIDEIKGMYRRVDRMESPVYVHLAQAMVYAYIYASENAQERMGVQMTYCNLETEELKYFRMEYSYAELREWFEGLWKAYHRWADFECRWRMIRNASIHGLDFPYAYRDGQKSLVTDVYRTILRRKILFLQAPTGVGKTISTVFPAVKAVGEEKGEKIFYLTAKTITASVARDTFRLFRDRGYRGKTIQLTAKEKICFCEETDCNPISCPYAKGHFDRVNDAVFHLLQAEDLYTREMIMEYAKRYMVCPFEFSLDVSTFCDNIICDYNYAFDPQAMLKRFFAEDGMNPYILLVDEAHNLVERSREMYSALLYKEDFLAVKKIMKTKNRKIERLLERCNKKLLEYKRECEQYRICEDISDFMYVLMQLGSELDDFLQSPEEFAGRKEVTDFYFQIRSFEKIFDLVDDHYVIYTQLEEDGRFAIKLFCVDPSINLQKCLDKCTASIFFSATLLPVNYYKDMFSTREDNYAVYARSVFTQEQRLLMMATDVSTRYTRRNEREFARIAEYLYTMIRGKKGNYMAFFPSYKLMEQVRSAFFELAQEQYAITTKTWKRSAEPVVDEEDNRQTEAGETAETQTEDSQLTLFPEIKTENRDKLLCLVQNTGMKEEQREAFLQEFEQTEATMLAFCVMGGIFGEGIDLPNNRLIGVAVVGTGLPQISNEREILKNYYEAHGKNGFDYALRFPGINKVLQAAGRVIRTSEDRGIILLLDERFRESGYRNLFPREWDDIRTVSGSNMSLLMKDFWEKQP